MGLPKNYRKNLKFTPTPQGFEARQGILNDIANPGTYLPKGILHEDMDREFVQYMEDDITLVLNGEKVPVIFLSIQRWAEFAKTWQFSDEYKNITMPFITIIRKPDAQTGTNYAGKFNVPGKPTFTYMKIPTWDGNIKSFDIYKIPQPVSVDLNYEVRLFCTRMRDLNILNRLMLDSFSAGEKYIRVNGHPIPLMMDNIGDESSIQNLDEKRYYVQLFSIKMLGYLLDPKQFEVTPAISRAINFFEVSENVHYAAFQIKPREEDTSIEINIQYAPGINVFQLVVENDTEYNNISQQNISSFTITVDGEVKNLPFEVTYGQTLEINITKLDVANTAFLTLIGNTK
tara:strand:- start:10290 stop:11321 length:1032 start_codon:yes stop_codon:yes gene_type:complete